MKKWILSLVILITLQIFASQNALAEKMDIDTTTIVIRKLEGVLSEKSASDIKVSAITLRLGDLYAERARLKIIRQHEKGCKNCGGVKADRLKALSYYEKAYRGSNRNLEGKILLQMAHLNIAVGRLRSGEALYKRLVKQGVRRHGKLLVARTHVALGDLKFQQRSFSQALNHYTQSLKYPVLPRKGYSHYRSAWCLFNLGRLRPAKQRLISILRNPSYLDLDGSGAIDASFHEDVARDLATFLAKGRVGQSEIQILSEYSPRRNQLENLNYLAVEVDRLGKKYAAISVWTVLLSNKIPHQTRLDGHARLARLLLDTNRKSSAVKEMGKGLAQWKSHGCKEAAECDLIRKRYRKMVTDWNQIEKKKVSLNLLRAYQAYITTFPRDVEMVYWGALVARDLNQFDAGYSLYRQSSVEAYKQLKAGDSKNSKVLRTIFEGALLGEIEMAEGTKNPKLRLKAYDHYLTYNPRGSTVNDVKYQKAMVFYEQKSYKMSAELFRFLALDKRVNKSTREKSADLALDSLVLMKDHENIEKWSIQFSAALPSRRAEYAKIARTSVLNQSKKTISKKDDSEYRKQLKKLKAIPLVKSSHEEQVAIYKNRIILAERLEDLNEIWRSAQAIINLKGVSAPDVQFALGRQLFVAEMKLDFGTAYNLLKKMDLRRLKKDQKALKMAMYAELSGKPSRRHYEEFIDATNSRRRANEIRIKLIKQSRYPWAGIDKEMSKLRSTPDLLGEIALWTFSKYKNYGRAEKVLKSWNVAKTPAGKVLNKQLFLRDFRSFRSRLAKHRIRSQSDRLLQNSLQKRIGLLGEAEQYLLKASRMNDWSLQIMTLSVIAQQNERLYAELLRLPTPAGLNQAQRQQYKALLNQRAAQYKKVADVSKKKLDEFWGQSAVQERFYDNYRKLEQPVRGLVAQELKELASYASRWKRFKINRVISSKEDVPRRREILAARNRLKNDPFSRSRMADLRELEEKAGGELMVAFLDSRRAELKRGGR